MVKVNPNDDFFNYLVATDQLDVFLGLKEKEENDTQEESEMEEDTLYDEDGNLKKEYQEDDEDKKKDYSDEE
jgi:hypothetical protein